MKLVRVFVEALRTATSDLARRPLFSLLSAATMAAAMLALASFLILSRGAREVFGQLADQAAAEVYLKPNASAEQVDDLAAQLERDPSVRRVEKVSPAQALEEFARLYPDLGDVGDLLGEAPLPGALRITPQSADPDALARMIRAARLHPAALSVRYDREWLTSLARLGEVIRRSALVGAVVLLLAAFVTVGSVIRLALDDKLEEVTLLRLVGAPASYTVAPVLLGGGILGGAGAATAILLTALGRGALLRWAESAPAGALFAAILAPPPPLGLTVGLALVGVIAGVASAGLAAGRAVFR